MIRARADSSQPAKARVPSQRELRDSHLLMPKMSKIFVPQESDYVRIGERAADDNPFIEVFGSRILDIPQFSKKTLDKLMPPPPGGFPMTNNPVLMALRVVPLEDAVYPTTNLERVHHRFWESVVKGLSKRNPFHALEYWEKVHFLTSNEPAKLQKLLVADQVANTGSFLIVGASGMGKSRALQCILEDVPQVVHHKRYRGVEMDHVQLVWLYCQCPPTGTLRGLLLSLLIRMDLALGTNYYVPWFNSRTIDDALLITISVILHKHGLGVLVLDELQHLRARGNEETEKNLNFFVSLMNFLGIPIISVCTYAALEFLSATVRNARRLSAAGTIEFSRFRRGQAVMKHQHGYFLKFLPGCDKHPLTDAFVSRIYDIHQGFQFLLPNLVQRCSIEAAFRGLDHVTPEILAYYETVELKALRPILEGIRTGNSTTVARAEDALSNEEIAAWKNGLARRDRRRGEEGLADQASSRLTYGPELEFPDEDISDDEIAVQCRRVSDLLGKGDLYVALSKAGLIATEAAYGRFPA